MAATTGTTKLSVGFIGNIGIVLRVAVCTASMTSAASDKIAIDLFHGFTASHITARFDYVC